MLVKQLMRKFSRSYEGVKLKGTERPTKYTYLLIGIFIALFLQAFVHNYNIVYMALFLTFSLAITGSLFGLRNIRALQLHYLSHERAFANAASHFSIALSTEKNFTLYDITVIYKLERQKVHHVFSHSRELLHFPLTPKERGTHLIETIICESSFTLPHQRYYKHFEINHEYVTYPEPKGISLSSFINAQQKGHSDLDDFEGVKAYIQGDKLSHIHWKSLAKSDQLQTKVFSYQEPNRLLTFDFFTAGENDEARLSQLTLWAVECETKNLEFQILLPTQNLHYPKMEIDAILSTLAHY